MGPGQLRCRSEPRTVHSKKRALLVPPEQWKVVKKALQSKDPKQIEPLISAKKGLICRGTYIQQIFGKAMEWVSKRVFLAEIAGRRKFPGLSLQVYEGLLLAMEQHEEERRVRRDRWEVGGMREVPVGRLEWAWEGYVVFSCESGLLKITEIGSKISGD
jgi:hypothetical protein